MRIIDYYLLRELFKVLFAVVLVLCLIIASLGLIKLLEKAAIGTLNTQVVFPLVGYQILQFLARTLPPAFFFTILAVLGRLYRDYEMTALAACGVGTSRIYFSLGMSLIFMVPVTAWLALTIQPWAAHAMETIIAAQKQVSAEIIGIRAGKFYEYSRGDMVFYVESLNEQTETMHNIFVQNREHKKLGLITASMGQHTYDNATHNHFVTLKDGQRYEGIPGTANFTIAKFDSYTLRVIESTNQVQDARSARGSTELYRSTDVKDQAELWERVSYPISLITLMLVAIPLSKSLPRQSLHWRLFLAFLVYLIFLNTHTIAVSWMKKQVTPLWMGIWWVQALLLILAGLTLAIDSSWVKRLRRKWRRSNFYPTPSHSP